MPGSGGFGWLHPGRYDLGGAPASAIDVPFIAATTVVFTPFVQDEDVNVPFIAATTTVFGPTVIDGGVRRVSQLPVEVLDLPDNQKARVSQLPVEVLDRPDNQKARVSQAPVEVLLLVDSKIRVSQVPVEILRRVLYEDIYIAVID